MLLGISNSSISSQPVWRPAGSLLSLSIRTRAAVVATNCAALLVALSFGTTNPTKLHIQSRPTCDFRGTTSIAQQSSQSQPSLIPVSASSINTVLAWSLPSSSSSCRSTSCTIKKGTVNSNNWHTWQSASMTTTTSKAVSPTDSESSSSAVSVVQIPCLSDNYGYLIHDAIHGVTAAVDTPEAKAYQRVLQERGWTLTHIFNTHHHWDHTGGNMDLKNHGGIGENGGVVTVYGPAMEKDRIPGIDIPVKGGDSISFGSSTIQIMDVGGHTAGHIAYYFPSLQKVFVGDSLFALGCGRMFEGTPTQFWTSLQNLRSLPDNTEVYCAHEYTESNARFAISIEPGNADLVQRVEQIQILRSQKLPTVPSTMGMEKKTNPFLRCDQSEEIRKSVGATLEESDADAFAKVRLAKDNFR